MEMIIRVNLEDVYPQVENCDGEGCEFTTIAESIRDEITLSVKTAILKEIGNELKASVRIAVLETIKTEVSTTIKENLHELMLNGTIKPNGYETREVKITDHIESLFKRSGNEWITKGEDFLKNHTAKLAKDFAEDLKNKYDMIFAAKVVNEMGKIGLLNSEILKKLVSDKSGDENE